ncbi:MAG: molecular chaperone GroEL [Bacteroidetes bacterium]|nr:MAG: molecular chaperone GroEL [Bacteroidota bacterium]
MNKKTLYSKEARSAVKLGVSKITDAVKVTLGPTGRNVLIARGEAINYGFVNYPLKITKDGYETTRGFNVDDHTEKVGVVLAKEAAQKTVDQAGDGTTSTVVLLNALIEKGVALIEGGANPMDIKRGLDAAVEIFVKELKKRSTPIADDNEKIFQIASISANNDPVIGRIIADAFKKIGSEGIVDIDKSKSTETIIRIADGYRFDRSWVSPFFINKREEQIVEWENPWILLYEGIINHHKQIEDLLEQVLNPQAGGNRPIIIICQDAVEEGLGFLVANMQQGRLKVVVVKAPGFLDSKREEMEDIAVLTGGEYISYSKGMDIMEADLGHLGQAEKVIVNKEETIIIGGKTDKEALENLIAELRMNLTQAKNEDEAYPIEKRIAKLTAGVAVIEVGAHTETEMLEKMDRYDDAVRATKSAIAEGYIVGGGTAYLRIKTGNELFDSSTRRILEQICENTGEDPEKIIELVEKKKGSFGYNAKTMVIEDLAKAGVLDPVKVIRCAVQNAASSAGVALTTECLIADVF